MKENFPLLLEWQTNFNIWKNELNRQIKEDIPGFTLKQKITWKGDKNNQLIDKIHSLKQDLEIIKNTIRITNLEDELINIKSRINDLEKRIKNLENHSKKLAECSAYSGLAGNLVGWIPVIGNIAQSVAGIISSSCEIADIYV